MSDLISRHDIEWHHYLVADGNGMYHDEKVAYKSQIDDLPSAQPETQWIPCSERLPEHWVMVLITTIYGDIEFGHYNEEEKTWEWLCESGTNYWEECAGVLAWMTLPEPYRAERKDE